MITLTEITEDPKQKFSVQLSDNRTFTLELEFIEQQEQWSINVFDIPDTSKQIKGFRVVNSVNLLRQFQRIIPFGIAVISEDSEDPFKIDDFSSGRISFNILDQDEVDNIEKLLSTP